MIFLLASIRHNKYIQQQITHKSAQEKNLSWVAKYPTLDPGERNIFAFSGNFTPIVFKVPTAVPLAAGFSFSAMNPRGQAC